MESVLAALINAAAKVTTTVLKRRPRTSEDPHPVPGAPRTSTTTFATRTVYYRSEPHRFLNFGGRRCRIEPLSGGQSFLAPTHELFHDCDRLRRITRETIVSQP